MTNIFLPRFFYMFSISVLLIQCCIFLFVAYRITMIKGLPKGMMILGIFGFFGILVLLFLKGNPYHEKRKLDLDNTFQSEKQDYQKNYDNNPRYNNSYPEEEVFYFNGERIEREMKRCKYCGASIEKKASFCTLCGREL